MLQNIFLPEQIDSFYLFTRRIVALEIGSRNVYATVVRAHRRKKTIEKCVDVAYDPLDSESLSQAIAQLLREVRPYDKCYIALSSALAIYKTMTLPFASLEKIRLVVPFEIEASLPFALQDATLDVMVNSLDTNNNSSTVFIAAIKRTLLESTLAPFLAAGIQPQKVTLGALELYGFIKRSGSLPATGVVAIVHFNHASTTILLVVDGALKNVRVLAEGISEETMRVNFANHSQVPAHVNKFFSAIQFTLQATIKNEHIITPLSMVIVSGMGAKNSDLISHMSHILDCPCVPLQPQNIVHNNTVVLEQGVTLSPEFTISVATALGSDQTNDFNLGRMYEAPQELQQFKYQVITGMGLVIAMILFIVVYGFFNIRTLKNEATFLTEQMVRELNTAFNLGVKKPSDVKSLSRFLETADQKLQSEESIWFALSSNQRFSYLKYLQALATTLDREKLGLVLKRLSVKSNERSGEDTLILEGRVGYYKDITPFENGLKSTELFQYVPAIQEPEFSITLTINKNEKGGA